MMKHIKKILPLLIIAVLCFVLTVPAFAAQVYITDEAELLTEAQFDIVNNKLASVSDAHDMDIVIYTKSYISGSSIEDEAHRAYKRDGYSTNGLVLMIDIDYREWTIQAMGGNGEKVFNNSAIKYIETYVIDNLHEGDYKAAFEGFANASDDIMTLAENGTPYTEPFPLTQNIVLSLIVGFVVALISVSSMKSKLKTVRPQKSANVYTKQDSFMLTNSRDIFLYRTVSKTLIERKSSSGSSSSSHRSGSGRSGRF